MQFALLGPLEVRHVERVLALGGAKQRALLAMLLLNSNQVVSRDRLVGGLWGEVPPATATHTIETYVSRLRRLFHEAGADDILLTRPPGYLVRVEPDAVDVHRFDGLLRQGRGTG